jgi:hypothetical protein
MNWDLNYFYFDSDSFDIIIMIFML